MIKILEELSQTGVALLLKEPFYAHLFSGLNKEITGPGHEVQTLAVGLGHGTLTLFVNEQFWDNELKKPEHRYGVLKHELLHLVFRHLLVKEPLLDSRLMNIAFDLVVNQYIERDQLPDDSIFIESFPELRLNRGETWYYYYKQLESGRKNEGEDSSGKTASPSLDQIQSDSHGLERHQPWREIRSRSEMENAVLDTHLDSLLRTAHQRTNAAAWGNLPAGVRDMLDRLYIKPAAVNWRMALRQFSQSARSTRLRNTVQRASKRYGTTPGIKINRRQRVLVALDTSGSVGAPEFQSFFNEIRHLWRAGAVVEVVECDTQIHSRYKYTGITPELITGRGGTDFSPPLELANRERPDLMIYLTDGYAGPLTIKPTVPVIWLISPDGLAPSSASWSKLPGRKVKM